MGAVPKSFHFSLSDDATSPYSFLSQSFLTVVWHRYYLYTVASGCPMSLVVTDALMPHQSSVGKLSK